MGYFSGILDSLLAALIELFSGQIVQLITGAFSGLFNEERQGKEAPTWRTQWAVVRGLVWAADDRGFSGDADFQGGALMARGLPAAPREL